METLTTESALAEEPPMTRVTTDDDWERPGSPRGGGGESALGVVVGGAAVEESFVPAVVGCGLPDAGSVLAAIVGCSVVGGGGSKVIERVCDGEIACEGDLVAVVWMSYSHTNASRVDCCCCEDESLLRKGPAPAAVAENLSLGSVPDLAQTRVLLPTTVATCTRSSSRILDPSMSVPSMVDFWSMSNPRVKFLLVVLHALTASLQVPACEWNTRCLPGSRSTAGNWQRHGCRGGESLAVDDDAWALQIPSPGVILMRLLTVMFSPPAGALSSRLQKAPSRQDFDAQVMWSASTPSGHLNTPASSLSAARPSHAVLATSAR